MGKRMLGAREVAEQLGVSKAYSYKLIRRLNGELAEAGRIVIPGKVSASYFEEWFFAEPQPRGGVGDDGEQG